MAVKNRLRLLTTVFVTVTVIASFLSYFTSHEVCVYDSGTPHTVPSAPDVLGVKYEFNKHLSLERILSEQLENSYLDVEMSNNDMDREAESNDQTNDWLDLHDNFNKELEDIKDDFNDNTNKSNYIQNEFKDIRIDIKDSNNGWPSMYNGPGVCKIDQYDKRVTHKNRLCRRLPDAAIVGFEKCGTMTLLTFLGVHPDIIETSSAPNFNFFSTSSNLTYCKVSKKTECTPRGIIKVSKLAVLDMNPAKVYKFKNDMRLIFIVRDPVERALSHFVHKYGTSMDTPVKEFTNLVSHLLQDKTNTTYMRTSVLGFSFYILKLKEWLKYFPMKNIHIVDGDKFSDNPVEELQKIEKFLKLRKYIKPTDFIYDESKQFYCIKTGGKAKCMSQRKGRPHPRMMPHTNETLKKLYFPYNQEFYKLVGRKFSWDEI